MFTYYDVLGVDPNANQFQIKKAYKQRVKLVHPDIVHDDRAMRKAKLLNRAYAVLRKTDRRNAYDETLLNLVGGYTCVADVSRSRLDYKWLASVSLWFVAVGIVWVFNSVEVAEIINLLKF